MTLILMIASFAIGYGLHAWMNPKVRPFHEEYLDRAYDFDGDSKK